MKRPYKKLYTDLQEEVRQARREWIGDDAGHLPLKEAMEHVRAAQFEQMRRQMPDDFIAHMKGKPRNNQTLRIVLQKAIVILDFTERKDDINEVLIQET